MASYKILSCLLVLGLIDFSLTATIKTLTPREKLLNYFETELKDINKDFSEKSKMLCEHLLKDDKIQQANTTILLDFKNNITEYLRQYESLKQKEQYQDLVWNFSDITSDFADEPLETRGDFLYIFELLEELGFNEMVAEYDEKFYNLCDKKLLPQFEIYKTDFKEGEVEEDQPLNDWYTHIKTCKEQECYEAAQFKLEQIMF